jgi:signal transduction histidine kinase
MWRSRLRSALSRIDVRIAVATGVTSGIVASAALALLWMRTGYEFLETLQDECAVEARSLAEALATTTPAAPSAQDAIAAFEREGHLVRVVGAHGSFQSRRWPAGREFWDRPLGLLSSFTGFVEPRLACHERSHGSWVRVAVSLDRYRRDQAEVATQVVWSALFGWLGAAFVAVLAARNAMNPIAETTRALEALSEANLDARLPLRGTRDSLDDHVAALNRVLARLELAWIRQQSFTANVAHELRTPVNRMLAISEVALLRGGDHPDGEALEHVQSTAREMQRTVEAMLLLARGEAGRLPLERKPTDLHALARKLLELYEPAAAERSVCFDLRGGPARADVDADLFERALANLIDNALRFALEHSVVRASVIPVANDVEVVVEDAGPGIAPADRARAFERFERLGAGGQEGSGLGLPIVRMVAELHAGRVAIGASALGGARIAIRVPQHAPDAAQPRSGH